MKDLEDLTEATKETKADTLRIMKLLSQEAKKLRLPSPSKSFNAIQGKLEEDKYTVIVMGEAKRGKTSFINALLAANILPTSDHVATAHAFRIKHAEQMSFFLRFEDGSNREITLDDLERFGSQVNMDDNVHNKLEKDLFWIEVNVPLQLLPANMILVDTPGVGSLYSRHSEITAKFVPLADAVIFVCDTERPILKSEHQFIHKILHHTKDIFFILTKIDVVEGWREMLSRNKEVLLKEYGEHLGGTIEMWPVSNKNLRKVSQKEGAGSELFLKLSRFEELKRNLELFLFKVEGISRVQEATMEMEQYYAVCKNILARKRAALSAAKDEDIDQSIKELRALNNRLQEQWNENGEKRMKILRSFFTDVDTIAKEYNQLLTPSGKLYREIEKTVNEAKSQRAFKKLEKRIPEIIDDLFEEELNRREEVLLERIAKYLEEIYDEEDLFYDTDSLKTYRTKLIDQIRKDVRAHRLEHQPNSINIPAKIRRAIGNIIKACIHPLRALYNGINWMFFKEERKTKLRGEILNLTKKIIMELRDASYATDMAAGKEQSFAKQLFDSYKSFLEDFIFERVEEKKQVVEEEITSLKAIIKQKQTDRKKVLDQINDRLNTWTSIKNEIEQVKQSIHSVSDHGLR